MDAGVASTAVLDAFKARGVKLPVVTSEDRQEFLVEWQKLHLRAIAPTYPAFQWRTAVIAATMILSGKPVPKEWILPQPTITSATLGKYLQPGTPPYFYAMCGCQNLPGFPERWSGKPK